MDFKKNPHILIVDDNVQNIQILGKIVESMGYDTAVAMDGTEALTYMNREIPDLILLDVMMPEMDGYETCKKLKEDPITRDIPIIFITALSGPEDKIKAFESGAVDYITRPFVKDEVMARIEVHLNLKLAMEQLKKMSVTDELTGVYNRRFAYKILAREIEIAKREKDSFMVCYIDIDNLKKINDTYGHAQGDKLIITVVGELRDIVRKTDYIFRMGGDEFLLIFPGAEYDESGSLVARMREKLNKQKINDIEIDFSFGFTRYIHDEKKSIDDLIKEADAKMYDAKYIKKSQKSKENS